MAYKDNHTAKIDFKKQQMDAVGLVSERFPEVNSIVIQMTYLTKGLNTVLMLRTVYIFPTSHAYFNMDCMTKGCNNGGFDLTPIIKGMVKKHQKMKRGNLVCSGKNADTASDHANVNYEVTIEFNKKT